MAVNQEFVGRTYPPDTVFEVGRERIREFAEAVSGADGAASVHPVHRDPEAARRLPANAHLTFAGCEGDSLLYLLDAAGVEVSTGSACQAGVPRPSHVLLAMGVGEDDARGALRFSFGPTSTAADVDAAVGALPGAVERARAAGLSTLVGA